MSEEKAKKNAKVEDATEAKPDYSNKKKKVAWTLARCKKLARRYKNEREWQAGSPSSYKAANAHGWIKECASLFRAQPRPKLPKSA
jgi:hypothetical protein